MLRPAALLLLLAPFAAPLQAALDFESCTLQTPGTGLSVKAECATLVVPENPAAPGGEALALHVARVVASRPREQASDPLYFLAGGPGQAAGEAWPMVASTLAEITRYRDVILIDQRGTGRSNRLACPEEAGSEFSTRFDASLARQQALDCLGALDGDTRFYTTSVAADDIERVRLALGHDRINLLGVSYGTRLAQVYLNRYPQAVRRVVLDGVVPPSLVLGTEHAPSLDRALLRILSRCEADAACAQRFGDPRATLARLRERVAEGVPAVALRLPRSGELYRLEITRDVLAVALRMLSYASETQALVPLVLSEADEGRWKPLLTQALLLVEGLQEQIAHGMELSVLCSEDVPRFPPDLDQSGTLLGNQLIEGLRAQCEIWPVAPAATIPQASASQAPRQPLLLLSGEFDPVTPPAYGEETLSLYPAAAHWVVPGRGHGVLRHGCVVRLTAAFLDGADPREQDTSCIDRILPEPFFVRLTGPTP